MKKEYFIEQNGKKAGAFTLEELKQKDIYDSALIWKAGWEEWKKALEVEELEGFVIITPPPTAQEKDKIIKVEKKNAFIVLMGLLIYFYFTKKRGGDVKNITKP